MGFLDKAREAAAQATVKAQQGVAQGQAKIDEMQVKRQADGLMRELGAAYYAQERRGGSPAAVSAALTAVDNHVAAQGTDGTSSAAGSASPPPMSSADVPPPVTQPGNYRLDDL